MSKSTTKRRIPKKALATRKEWKSWHEAAKKASDKWLKENQTETFPDNAPWRDVLKYIIQCAGSWEPQARLMGNARAGDIKRACQEAIRGRTDTLEERR